MISDELYQKSINICSVEQEIKEKFKYLDELDFLVKKYNSFRVFELYQNFASKTKLQRLADCGTYLGFDLYKHILKDEYQKKLSNANFCRDRFCEFCNWRRARKLAIQNFQTLKTIQMNQKVRYIFATFTIKNPLVKDLRENVKLFNKAWKRMTQSKRWKNSILGYVKAIEIPFQKSDKRYINLHAHCLLVVPSVYFKGDLYIKQEEYQEMWKKALRVDYDPSVDIRIIKSNKNRNEDDEIASVVAETTKYPLKSIDLNGIGWKVFQILTEQVKGMRFVSFGGVIKEYRAKLFGSADFDDDDLIYTVDTDLDELFWEKIGRLWYILDGGKYVLQSFEKENIKKEKKMIKLKSKKYEIENEDIELSVKFKDKFININFDFNAEFEIFYEEYKRIYISYFEIYLFEDDLNVDYDKFNKFVRNEFKEYLEENEYFESSKFERRLEKNLNLNEYISDTELAE